jgi:hypothetical protein
MASIAAGLESQKIPFATTVNWRTMQDRAVLALEGGQPGDLDFRFKMNAVLRSTLKATAKNAVLRDSKKATLSFEGTRRIPVLQLEELLESLIKSQKGLSEQIRQCYKAMGKPIPGRYLLGSDEGSTQAELPLPAVSQEGKKGLAQIIAMEQLEKTAVEKEEAWHSNVITRQLVEKTISNANTSLAARLALAKKNWIKSGLEEVDHIEFEKSETHDRVRAEAPMPKILGSVAGIHLSYASSRDILSDDYPKLISFIERHGSETLWYAPQEARDSTGALQPLSPKAENLCFKNRAKDRTSLANCPKEIKEAMAWRWLIISHNHVWEQQVKLPAKLRLSYERKPKQSKPAAPALPFDANALKEVLKEVVKSQQPPPTEETPSNRYVLHVKHVDAFVGAVRDAIMISFGSQISYDKEAKNGQYLTEKENFPGFKGCCDVWNRVLNAADEMMFDAAFPGVSLPDSFDLEKAINSKLEGDDLYEIYIDSLANQPSPPSTVGDEGEGSTEWDLKHPEFITRNGLDFFRFDVQILEVEEGQVFQTFIQDGVEYRAIVDNGLGPSKPPPKGTRAKLAPRSLSPPPPEEFTEVVGKGKAKAVPKPQEPKPKKAKASKGEKESDGDGPPVPALMKENPLRAKGEPKSKALADGQRTALRQFFKLESGIVDPSIWKSLTNKEKAKEMQKRSIPKWASESVLRKASNLQLILEGKLTKENANSASRSPKVAVTKPTAQAMEAWQQLKADFKGTPLYRHPVTSKEKAFKKRFDTLVTEYGEQPCFPKLKERPDQQGRTPSGSNGRRNSSQGGAQGNQGLIDMIALFAQIGQAFGGSNKGGHCCR